MRFKMVIRINKTKNYVVMSNEHLQRKDMSLKAKGLLSLMLSLPEEWIYSIDGLCSLCMENETAIKSALNELKEHGYLTVKKVMPTTENGGRISYEYNIYELPQEIQGIEKQGVENLHLEIQGVENQPYINNKIINNKRQNIKDKKEKEEKEKTINDIIAEQKEELQEPLREYVKMRKAIKKPITTHGLELALKRLNELTSDTSVAVKIINQSIMNSWQGLFELKPENKTNAFVIKTRNYSKEEFDNLIDNIDDIEF